MRFRSAMLFACLAACFPPLYAAKVPLAAFVDEDKYSHPRLSPDGRYLAVTVRMPIKERMVPVVSIYQLPEMKVVGAMRMPDYEMPLDYIWLSKTRLALTKSKEFGSREKPVATGEVQAMEFDGSKQSYLYGYKLTKNSRWGERYGDDYGHGYITGVPLDYNGHVYLNSQEWDGKHSTLYDIDSQTGVRKSLAEVPQPYLSFVLQSDGKPRFAYGIGTDTYAVHYRYDDAAGDWVKQPPSNARRFIPLAFSADNREFVAYYSADGGPDQLIKEEVATGKRTTLFADPHGEVDRMMWGAKPGLPFGAISPVGIPFPRYFDPEGEDARLHQLLSAQFPDNYVNFINFTTDGQTLLFSVSSDRDPGAYYLFNRKTLKADFLFSAMEKIEPKDMSERRPISFKARDGKPIYGYLTMPAHPAGTKLPLVLLPHGGPHGVNDDWFFDSDAQFLASRGYAVLQVNFRGSGGRGLNFERSGYRQWGAEVQDDLIDAVRWAIAEGEVDGNRVCSYGVSFGAYSALMLAAREPSLFKCAVGYAGIYDLKLLYTDYEARSDKRTYNTIAKYVGEDRAELDRFSPAMQAARITAPVLLVHGEEDKVAPVEHAKVMREALIKANRPPEWMLAANEGHGFYNTRNLTMFYEKLEAFLGKHIGPQ